MTLSMAGMFEVSSICLYSSNIFIYILRCDEPGRVTCGDRDPDGRPCKVHKKDNINKLMSD